MAASTPHPPRPPLLHRNRIANRAQNLVAARRIGQSHAIGRRRTSNSDAAWFTLRMCPLPSVTMRARRSIAEPRRKVETPSACVRLESCRSRSRTASGSTPPQLRQSHHALPWSAMVQVALCNLVSIPSQPAIGPAQNRSFPAPPAARHNKRPGQPSCPAVCSAWRVAASSPG